MTERRRSAARLRMLDAAEQEFAEQGFEAATMDRIAATARVSKSHLYYHFDSKDELLEALLQVRAAQILAEKDDLLTGAEVLDRALVERMLTAGIDRLLGARPRFLRVVVRECFRPGGRADLVFAFLRGITDDTVARFRGLGVDVDAAELTSAITWFGLLPILAELLLGDERARVLGLDAATEHDLFADQLEKLYTGYFGALVSGGSHDAR